MKILFVWADRDGEMNCSQHRCFTPAFALQRAGHDAKLVHCDEWSKRTPETEEMTAAAELVVFQRNVFMENVAPLLHWRAQGKPIVVDLDDHYKGMSPETGSPSAVFWKDGIFDQNGQVVQVNPVPVDQLEWGVKFIGAVSAPSRVICADWEPYAKTYFIPNYINPRFYQRKPVYKEPGVVYIGWGGSLGHGLSWSQSGLPAALRQIANEFKQVKIVIMGSPYKLDVSPSRRIIRDWVPYVQWGEFLSLLDIGLVPLFGEYDRRRSCLKSLEYTAMGIPWIGTDMEPNREIGSGQLVQNTMRAWHDAIADYIKRLDEIAYMTQVRASWWVRDYDVDRHVDDLIDVYKKIIEEAG